MLNPPLSAWQLNNNFSVHQPCRGPVVLATWRWARSRHRGLAARPAATQQTTLQATYMEDAIQQLADRAQRCQQHAASRWVDQRSTCLFRSFPMVLHQCCIHIFHSVIIGIAGCPGSGKTTTAHAVCYAIGPPAVVLPMDGFHYTRAHLDAMPDPACAHARRGAPFTFDADAFVACVQQVGTHQGTACRRMTNTFHHIFWE